MSYDQTKLLCGGGGKRGPPAPLTISSDEGDVADHDDEWPSSPSSTCSGPIYTRPPGFAHHGQDIKLAKKKTESVLKTKKKLKLQSLTTDNTGDVISATTLTEEDGLKHPTTVKQMKQRRDPMPMRRRALPQSFWQQPNNTPILPPGSNYTVLPPLWKYERSNEDLSEVRPVTPPEERDDKKDKSKVNNQPRPPLTTLKTTSPNTELLFSLFDVIAEKKNTIKRGRPRRVPRVNRNKNLIGNDPFMVQAMESLLPSLTIEAGEKQTVTPLLSLVAIKDGDTLLSLPSLTIEHNYPALLSEVVKVL